MAARRRTGTGHGPGRVLSEPALPSAWSATIAATLVRMIDGDGGEDGEVSMSGFEEDSDEDTIADLTVESLASIDTQHRGS